MSGRGMTDWRVLPCGCPVMFGMHQWYCADKEWSARWRRWLHLKPRTRPTQD